MGERSLGPLTDFLGRMVLHPGAHGLSDAQLLERFGAEHDEAAFAALVQRHGPMVFAVCRRVLQDHHAAEDAFQATFLVLARKSRSISQRELLGNWLYGVAYRTALKARSRLDSYAWQQIPSEVIEEGDLIEELAWREARSVLDEEIGRLPERFRKPLVLCYLQGLSYREAAKLLNWSLGTVSGRIAKAREILRLKLIRRGLTLSASLLATLLGGRALLAEVPVQLARITVKAGCFRLMRDAVAAGLVSQVTLTLTQGALRSMLMTKVKTCVLTLTVMTLLLVGGGATWLWPSAHGQAPVSSQNGGNPLQPTPAAQPYAATNSQDPFDPAVSPADNPTRKAQSDLRIITEKINRLKSNQKQLQAELQSLLSIQQRLKAEQQKQSEAEIRALRALETALTQLKSATKNNPRKQKVVNDLTAKYRQARKALTGKDLFRYREAPKDSTDPKVYRGAFDPDGAPAKRYTESRTLSPDYRKSHQRLKADYERLKTEHENLKRKFRQRYQKTDPYGGSKGQNAPSPDPTAANPVPLNNVRSPEDK